MIEQNQRNRSKQISKRQLLKKCWAIVKPYWVSEEKFGAWSLFLLSIVLVVASGTLVVVSNRLSGQIISELTEKDVEGLTQTFLRYIGLRVILVPIGILGIYLPNLLQNFWRRWMTRRFLGEYLSDRSYYNLTANSEIDNPDQRIAEDIDTVTTQVLDVSVSLSGAISGLVAAIFAVWRISQNLLIVVLIYVAIVNLFSLGLFGRILNRLKFQKLKREADFRFGLIRVRDNAESIAFYQGETLESERVNQQLQRVIHNEKKIILWEYFYFFNFTQLLSYLPTLLTIIVLAPRVLSRQLKVGVLQESRANLETIYDSLSLAISYLGNLTLLSAAVDRLEALERALEQRQIPSEGQRQIDYRENGSLAISHLTLQTPNYQRTLFEDLSVKVPQGSGLLVMGESGSGKSSLLRAIAGLWKSGTGLITRPKLSEMLFLPQRPYMILGTLREQLLYPNTNLGVTNDELLQALKQVNLPDLPERVGGFDVEADFAAILSLGEQQRLAFARLLLAKPKYAILDESSSALDAKNEARLYQLIKDSNSTFLSVGHRPTLVKYHDKVLELNKDRDWQLLPAATDESEA